MMDGWTDGRTNNGPVWGDSDPQWLLPAQQLPPGCVASSVFRSPVPRQPSPRHGSAPLPTQEVSGPLALPGGEALVLGMVQGQPLLQRGRCESGQGLGARSLQWLA